LQNVSPYVVQAFSNSYSLNNSRMEMAQFLNVKQSKREREREVEIN
jgi:hypothetical protein